MTHYDTFLTLFTIRYNKYLGMRSVYIIARSSDFLIFYQNIVLA
jgi:hypothetical protein